MPYMPHLIFDIILYQPKQLSKKFSMLFIKKMIPKYQTRNNYHRKCQNISKLDSSGEKKLLPCPRAKS